MERICVKEIKYSFRNDCSQKLSTIVNWAKVPSFVKQAIGEFPVPLFFVCAWKTLVATVFVKLNFCF